MTQRIVDTDELEKLISTSTFADYSEVKRRIREIIANSHKADDVVKDAEKWRSHEKELQLELLNALNLNEQ